MNRLAWTLSILTLALCAHAVPADSTLSWRAHRAPKQAFAGLDKVIGSVRQSFRPGDSGWLGTNAQQAYSAHVDQAGVRVAAFGAAGPAVQFEAAQVERDGKSLGGAAQPTRAADGSLVIAR